MRSSPTEEPPSDSAATPARPTAPGESGASAPVPHGPVEPPIDGLPGPRLPANDTDAAIRTDADRSTPTADGLTPAAPAADRAVPTDPTPVTDDVVATDPLLDAAAVPATSPAPTDAAEKAADAAHKAGASSSALFGRGMIYVVVSSLQLLTGALASPILAHLLGDPAEFGRLSSAIALHQLLIVVAIVGLDQAIVLKRSEDGHDHNVRALASTSIMLATAVTALLWLTAGWWAPLFGFDAESQLALITVLWTIPSAGVMVQLALLLTADRLKPYAVVSVLAAVGGQVAGIVAVLIFGRQAAIYAWGLLGADLVAAVIGWTLTRPTLKRAFSWSLLKPSLALGTPLMFGALSMFVLNAGDRIIIQRELGPAEVGRYQVAYTVGFVAVQMIGLTSKAWTPRFAAIRDRTLRWQIIGASRDSIYALLSPVVLGIILAAPLLLRIVAPASFQPETLLVVTLLVLIGAYPVAASGASSRMLITSRRARPLASWMAVAGLVNIAANFALIPAFGIAGSAGATIVAYTVQCLGMRWSAGHRMDWPKTPPRTLVQAAAAVTLGAASTALPQTTAWNIARLVLALACLPWCWIQLQRTRRGL